ncbi:MAG: putative molybdenum carrier protein [Deltaproteobacteria bacterium]|nr:putative molybdenum carrier protein [Deltaproteobacteria bacterium]
MSTLKKILSGGQTGVDRAVLDVALARHIPCGGWCPRGRRAEDGTIALTYPLQETPLDDYVQRTEWNVRDADGLLIVHYGKPTGGTALAVAFAQQYCRPYFLIDLTKRPDKRAFHRWLEENAIETLSVGGPRESHAPGFIYAKAKMVFKKLLDCP